MTHVAPTSQHAQRLLRLLAFVALLAAPLAPAAIAPPAHAAPETVTSTIPGSPRDMLKRALLAAKNGSFEEYLEYVTPDMKWTQTAIEHLRRYSWKRFSGRVLDYIVPGTKDHFIITREEIDEKAGTARIFLAAPGNKKREMPTPCRFKMVDGAWLVHENSL